MKVLLVEDDEALAEVVARGLGVAGFQVEVVRNGTQGLEQALGGRYGLLILDLMLPDVPGTEICRRVRAAGLSNPILMLTALDAVRDRVQGLEMGADDYLVKPFDFQELLARVRALARRDKVHRARVLQIAHLKIDTTARRVWIEDEEIALRPREYDLLEALAVNEGRVLSRDTIQDRIWQNDESYSNVVEAHIRRLRAKVERRHLPNLIVTVHSLGYSLRRPEGER